MSDTLVFYFDLASPYGYFASTRIDALAAKYGLKTEWKPFLMWALVNKSGIAVPLEAPARRAYFLKDIARSAAFYDMTYQEPPKFGAISTHLAARLFYNVADQDPDRAKAIAFRLFEAYLANGRDISDKYVFRAVATEAGLSEVEIADALTGTVGRLALETAVEDALGDGVIGSPFFVFGDQGFFGVDRLPQLEWHLERTVR